MLHNKFPYRVGRWQIRKTGLPRTSAIKPQYFQQWKGFPKSVIEVEGVIVRVNERFAAG